MNLIHWSDCAIYNEPAYPAGPCDCGAAVAPKAIATILECQKILGEYILPDSKTSPKECIDRLFLLLDDKELVKMLKEI